MRSLLQATDTYGLSPAVRRHVLALWECRLFRVRRFSLIGSSLQHKQHMFISNMFKHPHLVPLLEFPYPHPKIQPRQFPNTLVHKFYPVDILGYWWILTLMNIDEYWRILTNIDEYWWTIIKPIDQWFIINQPIPSCRWLASFSCRASRCLSGIWPWATGKIHDSPWDTHWEIPLNNFKYIWA